MYIITEKWFNFAQFFFSLSHTLMLGNGFKIFNWGGVGGVGRWVKNNLIMIMSSSSRSGSAGSIDIPATVPDFSAQSVNNILNDSEQLFYRRQYERFRFRSRSN